MHGLQSLWFQPNPDDLDDEAHRAGALIAETAEVEQYQYSWHELALWNALLYSNRYLVGFNWGMIADNTRELCPVNLHTENLIKEIGDTMVSKASSSPLRPTLVPHGNSWKIERAVRQLDSFQLSVYRQTEAEDAAVRAYLDSYISGIGCVHSWYDEKSGHLHADPVFFDSIVVDNRECVNRQDPRTYRIRRVVPVTAIEAQYGNLTRTKERYVNYRSVGDQWEVVVEAWRLPDSSGKGGRHSKACRGRLLIDEPWKETWVPLDFYHHTDRLSGFYGSSGVEALVPYQTRHNELNEAIKASQDIACRPRMKVHANSQINLDQWDNEAGRFLMWSGSEPMPLVWPTNLNELYQERDRNRTTAYQHVGQSEMSAGAVVPQGVRLDSSAGIREFRNMEDSRHLRDWTRFEKFRLAISKTLLRVLSRHPEAKAYESIYHPPTARRQAKRIAWEAVRDITEDCYSWTLDAAPLSQQTPAARRETLRDYVSRGVIDDAQAKMMLTNPNIEWQDQLEIASYDDISRHIEILEDGGYEAPTEITNIQYGIKRVTANVHRLRVYSDVPQDIIENHLRWLVTAAGVVSPPQPPMDPMMGGGAPMPDEMTPFAPTQGMPGTHA